MSDDQDAFYDLPFGKMSQTAKRYCFGDFHKEIKNVTCTTDKMPLNNHSLYPVGIVGRATRHVDEHQKDTPSSKSFKRPVDRDNFLNEDQFSLPPFESLPHPQKLRKKTFRRVKPPRRDFNKDFLVDNHLRQLKKRYACIKSSENNCEQSLSESLEMVDTHIQSSEEVDSCCTDEFDFPLIPQGSSPIDSSYPIDAMFKKQYYEKQQKQTMTLKTNNLMTQGNEVKLTYLDLQLRKDFMMQNLQPFSSSTPVKEE